MIYLYKKLIFKLFVVSIKHVHTIYLKYVADLIIVFKSFWQNRTIDFFIISKCFKLLHLFYESAKYSKQLLNSLQIPCCKYNVFLNSTLRVV